MNVAGYISWGANGEFISTFTTNGTVAFSGDSKWYPMMTIESFNGQRDNPNTAQGNFLQWFSTNAFGSTNYENAPVGAVSYVEEPGSPDSTNDPFVYFGDWTAGKCFAICAWISSQRPAVFQAVGDPFVTR